MSVTADCTEDCDRIVHCAVCKRQKPPIGRSVATAASGGYCEHECPGHNEEPRGGHLWPGELRRAKEGYE